MKTNFKKRRLVQRQCVSVNALKSLPINLARRSHLGGEK